MLVKTIVRRSPVIAGLIVFISAASGFAAETKPLAKLTISGVSGDLKEGLERHLPVNMPECTASKEVVSDYFRTLKTSLVKGGRALGYYNAEYTSGGKIVDNCWQMTMEVKPGDPVRVISQLIEVVGPGSNDRPFVNAMRTPPYQQGDILNHQLYTDFKDNLTDVAESRGYLDAVYEQHALTVDPVSNQARVNLVLNTGPRYTFGDIKIEQDVISDKLMTRFIKIKPGTPYSTNGVLEQQQILQKSGYYSDVIVNVDIKNAKNQQVPVNIKLTRAKRDKLKFTLGYGTDTGARVKTEALRRYTGSKGRSVEAKAQWAETLSKIELKLIEPRENPDYDALSYMIDWTYDTANDVDSASVTLGTEYKRKLSNNWEQAIFINALIDRTSSAGSDADSSYLTLVGGRLSKTKTNSEKFASSGWSVYMQAQAAVDNLLSDQSVSQFEFKSKYIFPFGKGRLVNRLDLGLTSAGELEDLPKSLRFFAGGGSSVRGYDFESIGEENSSGSVVGGKNLLVGSVEYEHPIKDAWSIAAFIDAGDAFNEWNDIDLEIGVGFGGRYRSPIGPVRVDVGFPEGRVGDATFHLSVGPDL